MKTVHVAAGIIRNPQDNSVLAVQRGYGDMQGLWEFPGGKVQRGETAYDACIRELQEELCVEVHNLRAFYTVEYDYEAFHLSMECFFCDIARETQHVGGGEHHIFQHGHVREQVELLEDHAQLGAHGSELATFLRQRLAIDKNLTRVDGLQTIDGTAEGRFARTGWANNHDNFAGDD